MIDWAFWWLTPTQRVCISLWAGISSDTQIFCLPPKSGVLLPFEYYFWMIFSFMLLYLLQLNSYPLLLDLLRFSPAQLLGQRVSSIKPVLVGHSLLSPHACFQLTAHPTRTWWGGNHMLCVFCTEWFMQIDKTQPQLRPGLPDVWLQHGQSTTVLMDMTLLCTAPLTHSHESSLNKQVFIFENATRVFWVFFHNQKKLLL